MQKTLSGYVWREELGVVEKEGTGALTVVHQDALRFTAFQMKLASGDLVPIQITFNEKVGEDPHAPVMTDPRPGVPLICR